ncbi:MAG: hypothetical protein A2X86_15640 [Bdellovibrionales bacterium GWA2_49_15]|nr:MAG: hypothetical protein A2X86_15640 [Bdellovibrionales bacterium GWA2_49_15]HAZ14563.1 hypothetical protein [Bdellovibrionales bacterium]
MRSILVLLALCLSLASFNSNARSIISSQSADFYRIDYTSAMGENFVNGTVSLDYVNNKIKVFLIGENNCPRGAYCFRGPTIENLVAPMVSRERLGCGQNVYKAEKNDLAVDGYDVSITVSDMTHLVCRIRPMAATIVEITKKYFDRVKGEEVVRQGRLFAHPLHVDAPMIP